MASESPGPTPARVAVCQFDGVDVLPALPLAAGLVVAAARGDDALHRAFDYDIHTVRESPAATAERLAGSRIAAFSGYAWNWHHSLAVARRLKEIDAAALVVLGGPCVPRRPERSAAFLSEHPYVDALVLGEGEVPFRELLRAVLAGRGFDAVPSLVLRGPDGAVAATSLAPRLRDFTGLGSPYLDGTFDACIARDGPYGRAAVIETNRGCPFTCTFCDWGQAIHTRVNELPLERVHAELEWIARRRIPYLYVVDANFGIRPRDLGLARHLGALHRRHGAPAFCHFHLTKNATERNLATVAELHGAGVGCQVVISVQDTDERVLAAVKRANIRPARALALRGACNAQGVPTLNELLLGLPDQTLPSLRATLAGAVSPYPGDSFFVYPVRVLENAELGSPEELERHGLVTRAVATAGGETEDIVVATRTLPAADWRRAWRFAQVLSAAYNLRLLHLLVHHVRFTHDDGLADLVEHLLHEMGTAPSDSAFAALHDVLERHGRALESGTGLSLPVPGHGPARRGADEALALTALAHGDRFWRELRDATDRWRPLDDERGDLLAYQRFVTAMPGDASAERTFEWDWPAWDGTRGAVSDGPTRRSVRVRRVPPPFAQAPAESFAACWLHAAYAKTGATAVDVLEVAVA